MIDNQFFAKKKVLITGCTGFKGSWLSIWLHLLGAKIYGLALEPPTNPSLYEEAQLENYVENNIINIKDADKVSALITNIQPDFIFHLAAQPLVKYSYLEPRETWQTNLMGTVNVLDSLRLLEKKCIGIIITSDKCYENQEWEWGYRETDKLGGGDPYSASKGAAELAFSSYYRSFFSDKSLSKIRIASARAGNVIGGGDWADNRIIPDCIKAWMNNSTVEIKSPYSTRPFQHVLEPLSGYISLAIKLNSDHRISGQSLNFGPLSNSNHNVIEVVKKLSQNWENSKWEITKNENDFYESKLLKLNCDKALSLINWEPTLNFEKTMKFTSDWYYDFYKKKDIDIFEICCKQIREFSKSIKPLI